jgi:shikimate dehydrogenase
MLARLDGRTRVSVIIGTPIAQVRSPEGITREMQARGLNAVLVALDVQASDVAGLIAALGCIANIDGITVTVPHKQAAFNCCREASDRARFLGAVNVMRRLPAGGFVGDHVDGESMLKALAAARFEVRGCFALLVGAGGAGSAIALALMEAGAARLQIADADEARRDGLVGRLASRFGPGVSAGVADPRGFDLVVMRRRWGCVRATLLRWMWVSSRGGWWFAMS